MIQFTVCFLNVECGVHYLEYYDGDKSHLIQRFCGLKQGSLPTSLNRDAILKLSEQHHWNYELKIRYQAVDKDLPNTGIIQILYEDFFWIFTNFLWVFAFVKLVQFYLVAIAFCDNLQILTLIPAWMSY